MRNGAEPSVVQPLEPGTDGVRAPAEVLADPPDPRTPCAARALLATASLRIRLPVGLLECRQAGLTKRPASIYIDGVGVSQTEGRRLMDAATSSDPEVGLTAVVALRQLVEVLEELQVDNARARGWSWRDIARRLGVSKQAVHYKHGLRARGGQQVEP
jgi:hypothetical protein